MTPFDTALKADLQTLQHTVEYEGQNFRERDADGNTLLHCAVRSGSLAKVAYLTDFLALDPRRLTVGTLGSLGTDDHLTARLRVVLVAAVGSRNKIMLGHYIVGYIRCPIAAPAFGPRHSGPVRVCNGVADSRPVY